MCGITSPLPAPRSKTGAFHEAISLLSDKVMSLEPLAQRYFEGVLLYVQLLTEAGEKQRAGQVLDQLQDMLDDQQVGLGCRVLGVQSWVMLPLLHVSAATTWQVATDVHMMHGLA